MTNQRHFGFSDLVKIEVVERLKLLIKYREIELTKKSNKLHFIPEDNQIKISDFQYKIEV